MATPTVATGALPESITIDPSGRYAYVADFDINGVSQYRIGANGELSPMSPAMVETGSGPVFVTVDPSGQYVYVVNLLDGTVSQFTIGTNGALTSTGPAVTEPGGPISIIVVGSYQ